MGRFQAGNLFTASGVLIVGVAVFSLHSLTIVQPGTADDTVEKMMRRVQSSREQVEAGEYEISVLSNAKVTHSDGSSEESEESWVADCTFDASAEQYRMHYQISGEFRRMTAAVGEPSSQFRNQAFVSALNADQYLFFDAVAVPPRLVMSKLNGAGFHSYQKLPPDFRSIGLHSNLRRMFKGQQLEDAIAYLTKPIPKPKPKPLMLAPRRVESEDGLVCLTSIFGNGKVKREICFDPNRNFVTVSHRRTYGTTDPDTLEFTPFKVAYEAKIDWMEFEGVHVPKTVVETSWLQTVETRGLGGPETWKIDINETSTSIEFTWKTVNQHVPESTFDYHEFGLPVGTLVPPPPNHSCTKSSFPLKSDRECVAVGEKGQPVSRQRPERCEPHDLLVSIQCI